MNDGTFPYRLAACDLDGTLLGPGKDIGAANLEAVRRLQGRGVRFTIASGRRHQNSVRYYDELGLEGWMISCGGALVRDPRTQRTLREELLVPALADELVARGQDAGFTIIYYHRDHLYVDVRNHWTTLYESRVGERPESFPGDLRELGGEAALKLVWYGDPHTLQEMRAALQEEYRGRAIVLSTDHENLEFSAPAANKAESLAAVAEWYGIPQVETLAFGDGENDAPMLRWAGLGVAVDGSEKVAQAAAGLVGPAGAPEERFARACATVFSR